MSDLIDRQAAIDALDQIFDRCEEIEAHLPEGDPDRTGYKMYPDYMTVWKYLHQLPSAQPMRKKGEWVSPFGIGCVCNCCGYDINEHGIDIRVDGEPNFCPNCGAKMEVTT